MPGEGLEYRSHDWCEPGFVALRLDDENIQDLLWLYARRIRKQSPRQSEEIIEALTAFGYDPVKHLSQR